MGAVQLKIFRMIDCAEKWGRSEGYPRKFKIVLSLAHPPEFRVKMHD